MIKEIYFFILYIETQSYHTTADSLKQIVANYSRW